MEQVDFYKHKLAYEIDSWDLHEAQKSGAKVVVLDVRQEDSYNKLHIKGAISYPHKNIVAENRADFNQDTLYVTYCDGLGCNAATAGAMKMAELGFTVKELIGGLTWWRDHNYPTEVTEQQTSADTLSAVAN